ncbi:MAG: 4-(cytidine 5'-diphospho)-2-C-methyl-D-erythritol kinase [Reyranella sp.]|uniref:4-(cytidine 5'-diphospho)-2-C-methyl-D-erythritol kinase n=1 Tax=Reyranella sp. TaxID=1929291 RepID=UPI0011FAC166|nr:4-(cytidine 5'-diphospho)-2-C-methyl-D-erythritol kinase [Reyranella sp.]TAJ95642.1 MAG: 4-(cytidine 5'-diphospho)-2-C-methyl-D-erythritol kinase [Reyranella sp.]TBR24416.1 MAG: 4-(cytidine 5'-diphospho)-2-C-methyl-D-erythritol kinase [Reyranella sp.]
MPLARAKVNLWLKVVGRRADGFHLLDSLVAFTDLADEIEVAPASDLSLQIVGPAAASLERNTDNLALKAARLLAGRAGVAPRAALRLTKRIPVAAGLGGGSADAAATLLALVELWRVAMPQEELFDLAATLGADVPMCLAGRPALASGIGERLVPAPALPACAILLVNPGTALPTPAVFGARQGSFSAALPIGSGWQDLGDLARDLARRGNDLTDAAISLQPEVADLLDRLRRSDGVAHVAMSGSGATCFGLYRTIEEAQRAASLLPASWWRHAGRLV